MLLEEFFQGYAASLLIFNELCCILDRIGPTRMRISKSQVAFWRRRVVVRAWIPGRYLRGHPAPLVLTLAFRQKNPSLRWKEIVHPAPGWFVHHLELWTPADLDAEVTGWLYQAWQQAG
ncbi:MAG TPA: DUF5655 domain-containing protein [Anaerolineaceae bacterium]|jgi:hypothetical protein|nr:DUF5655 domain-containing protein [Anaerolineaceae bacterium]